MSSVLQGRCSLWGARMGWQCRCYYSSFLGIPKIANDGGGVPSPVRGEKGERGWDFYTGFLPGCLAPHMQ